MQQKSLSRFQLFDLQLMNLQNICTRAYSMHWTAETTISNMRRCCRYTRTKYFSKHVAFISKWFTKMNTNESIAVWGKVTTSKNFYWSINTHGKVLSAYPRPRTSKSNLRNHCYFCIFPLLETCRFITKTWFCWHHVVQKAIATSSLKWFFAESKAGIAGVMLHTRAITSIVAVLLFSKPYNANTGLIQAGHACTTSGSYLNKRCSAFSASVVRQAVWCNQVCTPTQYFSTVWKSWWFWVDPTPR